MHFMPPCKMLSSVWLRLPKDGALLNPTFACNLSPSLVWAEIGFFVISNSVCLGHGWPWCYVEKMLLPLSLILLVVMFWQDSRSDILTDLFIRNSCTHVHSWNYLISQSYGRSKMLKIIQKQGKSFGWY